MHAFPNHLKTDKYVYQSVTTNQLHWQKKWIHAYTSSRETNVYGKWKLNFRQLVWFILCPLQNIIKTKCIQIGPETEQSHQEDCGRKWMQEGPAQNAKEILTVTIFYMPSSPRWEWAGLIWYRWGLRGLSVTAVWYRCGWQCSDLGYEYLQNKRLPTQNPRSGGTGSLPPVYNT